MTKYVHFPAVSESRKYPKVPEFLEKVPVSIRKYLQVPTGKNTQIFDHFWNFFEFFVFLPGLKLSVIDRCVSQKYP